MNDSLNSFTSWKHKWKHKLLTSLFSVLSLTIGIDIAAAQVTEDPTLPASENTQVNRVNFTLNSGIYEITGGAIRGNNENLLFHSFASFSIEDGRTAFFNHGSNIETILSRVTGLTASQIDGIVTAGINGEPGTSNADIFIINPQGILFGPNAALEIGGSFIASTAEQIVFADGVEFSANNHQPVPLLTVSQPIGLSLGDSSSSIVNQSTAGLEVASGESIMLVSNGISFFDGGVTSRSGRIELASLGENGSVNLIAPTGDDRSVWALEYGGGNDTLRDIQLSSDAFIDGESDTNGGANSHIRLIGSGIFLDNSNIYADNYGSDQGEDITLFASERLTLNNSNIYADNYGSDRGGNLALSASEFILTDRALVSVSTFSQGNGGNLAINVDGNVELLNESRILTQVIPYEDAIATGSAGTLTLHTGSLSLQDESLISTSTFSQGDGGDLAINVDGNVELLDESSILAEVIPYYADAIATGRAGTLTLHAGSLSLRDESLISTSTFSQGDGGDLAIDVLSGAVVLLGDSRLRSQSNRNATGGAGNLTIEAGRLSVGERAIVSTTAVGNGRGGNLSINTTGGSVEVVGLLSATTQGSEDAGKIEINTGILSVQEGGEIQAGTFGSGDGGLIVIDATELVVVTGQSSNSNAPSQISSTTASPDVEDPLSTTGNAGSIKITTGRLEVSEGAIIFTTSSSSGSGGNLTVEADEVVLSGRSRSGTQRSGLYARARSAGDSGTVDLTANTLRVENGARLTVSNRDQGEILTDNFPAQDFGTVRDASIEAQRIILDDGEITAESLSGNGGSLNFNVQDFILLRNNSLISASAGTDESGGNGGNVAMNIPDGFIIATPNENSDIIANAFSGTGGNVNITARNIIGADARRATPDNTTNDIDASSEFGSSGTITLDNFGLDPTEGLVELPTATATPDQVAQRCLADSEGRSAFVITGRGGTAPTPGDVVRNEAIGWVDLGRTTPSVSRSERQPRPAFLSSSSPNPSSLEPVVEAQGWQQDSNGTVTLIAQLPSTQAVGIAQYSSCAHQSGR